MNEERIKRIISDLNRKLGSDASNLEYIYDIRSEYLAKKNELEDSLSLANSEVPSKVSAAIKKAEEASQNIKSYQDKLQLLTKENDDFLMEVEPIRDHLGTLVAQIRKLEATKEYLESMETVQKLSEELNTCTDSEQSVLLIQELYELQKKCTDGHRGDFIAETAHYWYNVLRDKLSVEFDEALKLVKWPITSGTISLTTTVPPEAFIKFRQIVQFLLQIQMPPENNRHGDATDGERHLSLPVRLMLIPLKKRFAFHFTGNRRTNRFDRPEWFLTQILSWLRDHLPFLVKHLQPIADGLDYKINVQVEFTCGLVQLAVDRLHSLLAAIYMEDALFSHAIDECLGFDRELEGVVGFTLPLMCPRVTAVLTDAQYLIRWLAVEKKFAIQKIDEMLSGEEWLQPLYGTVELGEEPESIPRGADWLVSLLQTLHDRYSLLPQPGHRLQFLDLQTELCEEVRLRLTQLIEDELHYGTSSDNGRPLEGGSRLLAMLNVAHYFRQALIDWTHSVTYLQLHYYKKQFQCFTEMQHLPIPDLETTPQKGNYPELMSRNRLVESFHETYRRDSISLSQVEVNACELAQQEMDNLHIDITPSDTEHINSASNEMDETDAGVFEKLPSLLGRLVDKTCSSLCDDLVLEVKAASRDYRNQKWHYLPEVNDWQCRSLSPALCAPLGALSNRLLKLKSFLAPELFAPLWRSVAKEIDAFIFEEVVLECWWGPGGIQQFHFDMSRNLMPIFAQYTSAPESHLPRISESCKLLTMLRGTALLLRETIKTSFSNGSLGNDRAGLAEMSITYLSERDILRVLNQRTDMNINQ